MYIMSFSIHMRDITSYILQYSIQLHFMHIFRTLWRRFCIKFQSNCAEIKRIIMSFPFYQILFHIIVNNPLHNRLANACIFRRGIAITSRMGLPLSQIPRKTMSFRPYMYDHLIYDYGPNPYVAPMCLVIGDIADYDFTFALFMPSKSRFVVNMVG